MKKAMVILTVLVVVGKLVVALGFGAPSDSLDVGKVNVNAASMMDELK